MELRNFGHKTPGFAGFDADVFSDAKSIPWESIKGRVFSFCWVPEINPRTCMISDASHSRLFSNAEPQLNMYLQPCLCEDVACNAVHCYAILHCQAYSNISAQNDPVRSRCYVHG